MRAPLAFVLVACLLAAAPVAASGSAVGGGPTAAAAAKKKCKKGYVVLTVKKGKRKVKKCVHAVKHATKLLSGKKLTYYESFPSTGGSLEQTFSFCRNGTFAFFSQRSAQGVVFAPTTSTGNWKVAKVKIKGSVIGIRVTLSDPTGSTQSDIVATANKVYVGGTEVGVTSAGC